jgi:RNase H-like domain found in reverse transcriptase/Integrase zinc binding domain
MESHVEDLDKMLSILRDAGVPLCLDKCHFFRRRVNYLRHVIEPTKWSGQATEVDTNLKAKLPRTKTELRAFLGICNVYRRFVPLFATIAAPLTGHLRKDSPDFFNLEESPNAVAAFEHLRSMFTSASTLALPKQGLEYVLDTDATASQLSVCLQQRDEHGLQHPIGYWSRQLSPTERRYHITEKEAYAVYWAVKLLRPYLEGNRFTVRTDHSVLTGFSNADGNSTPLLTRWRLGLAQFYFIVKYHPGVQHQPADGLSRLVTLGHDNSAVEAEISCCAVADDATKESVPTPGPTLEDTILEPITLHELIVAQAQDAFCVSKLSELNGAAMKGHFAVSDKGLLVRLSPLDDAEQVIVPRCLANRVMCLAHLPRLASHPGGTRMYATLRKAFYWHTMAKDIYHFVANCLSCAKSRLRRNRRINYLRLFLPSQRLELYLWIF